MKRKARVLGISFEGGWALLDFIVEILSWVCEIIFM